MPKQTLKRRADGRYQKRITLSNGKTRLVYGRTGRRSADAVQKLDSLGYTNLYDLGGILSWPYEIEGDFEGHF